MAEVLIADDSAFACRLLRATLAEDHDVVGEAETGVEVVELAEAREPDVVVLEADLPIVDGVEAVEDLADQGVGIVVCSAQRDEATIDDAFDAGAHEFVVKPFQREGLLEAIDAALGARADAG